MVDLINKTLAQAYDAHLYTSMYIFLSLLTMCKCQLCFCLDKEKGVVVGRVNKMENGLKPLSSDYINNLQKENYPYHEWDGSIKIPLHPSMQCAIGFC